MKKVSSGPPRRRTGAGAASASWTKYGGNILGEKREEKTDVNISTATAPDAA